MTGFAKQSRPWTLQLLDCFVALLLAMTTESVRQNIRLSFISTQRPFLICCTCVTVVARWLVLENLVGGELKISWKISPDSSASSIFWPVRSLPTLLA